MKKIVLFILLIIPIFIKASITDIFIDSEIDISGQNIKINFLDKSGKIQNDYSWQVDSFQNGSTYEIKNEMFLRIIDTYDYSLELVEITGVG